MNVYNLFRILFCIFPLVDNNGFNLSLFVIFNWNSSPESVKTEPPDSRTIKMPGENIDKNISFYKQFTSSILFSSGIIIIQYFTI